VIIPEPDIPHVQESDFCAFHTAVRESRLLVRPFAWETDLELHCRGFERRQIQ
jgi:hypothetical protein